MGLGGLSGSYSKLRLESNSLSTKYATIPKTANKLVRVAVRRQFYESASLQRQLRSINCTGGRGRVGDQLASLIQGDPRLVSRPIPRTSYIS